MEHAVRKEGQLDALISVLQIINHTLDMDQVLNNSLRAVIEFMHMDAGVIRLWNEQTQELSVIAHYGFSDYYIRETGKKRETGGHSSGKVALTKKPFIVENASTDSRLEGKRKLKLAEGMQSFALIPLLSKEKVMAVMSIHSRSLRKFTDQEVRFLSSVGDQLGMAIDNAVLFLQIKQRNETLNALKSIEERINQSLELNQVMNDALAIMRNLLRVDAAHIRLLDEETGDLVLVAHQGYSPDEIQQFVVRRKRGEGTAYRIFMSKAPLVVENTALQLRDKESFTAKTGITSFASIPLKAKDKIIGTLSIHNRTPHTFTSEDVEIISSVGNQLGLAIDNAWLHHNLVDSERRYRELFESNPHPMWVYDIESLRFLMVNNAAVSHYGYAREEFLGMTIAEIHPPEDVPPLLQTVQSLAEGFDASGVWRHRKRDGSVINVEITSHALNFVGRRARVVLAHDITERKRSEEERERLQAQLLHAQKMEAVGRLAGGVAHDFNNMLGVILGHTELALERTAEAEPLRVHLEEIRKAGQRSADLTGQLLAFARKQTVAPTVLDLNDTLASMLKMLRRLIGEDVDLAWMPGAGLWPVRIDPAQIDQMLANLCINARDAIASVGKVTIETDNVVLDEAYCADHPGFSPGAYVMLAVSDDGSGMDKNVFDHLFEPFFTTKGVGQGTGLGLATVYGIVKQNDGFINVYSEPGRGTTFKIYLRACIGEAVPVPMRGPAQAIQSGTETILLVEDEEMLLELSKVMLEGLGYRVLTAGSPGAAIGLAETQAEEINLLITDVVLPEMSGRDLAERIRVIKPSLKCLFMSGYTANVIAHRGVLDEGVRFIQKPFSIKNLAAKVREALEQP